MVNSCCDVKINSECDYNSLELDNGEEVRYVGAGGPSPQREGQEMGLVGG
jgi:hypothetical protein